MRAACALLLFARLLAAQVDYERLVDAASEPHNWLTYSADYGGQRHSALSQIDSSNVSGLKLLWVFQHKERIEASYKTTPLVVDGIMYVTDPDGGSRALDTFTGRELWRFDYRNQGVIVACCGRGSRGAAILGNTLYFGAADANLFAVDARDGQLRWKTKLGDPSLGLTITAAPVAIDGKIIVGIGGGDSGVRGFIDAYAANDGRRLWRFWTVPAAGEPGSETWSGESWRIGGGATWVTGSYDPDLKLIYWGVGNPAPVWNGDSRAGDNLYTDSVVALDADTGKLRWHFQFTPHDTWDWDSCQIPVLADIDFNGSPRKALLFPNRNGFYYVLDRVSGEFLHARPMVEVNWTDGLDDSGRPRIRPGAIPTEEGVLIMPDSSGATNWLSPAYDPDSETLFVAVRKSAAVVRKISLEGEPGAYLFGGKIDHSDVRTREGNLRNSELLALEAATGRPRWTLTIPTPTLMGLLSTAGQLVFGGTTDGLFLAVDARSGKLLWKFRASDREVLANPVTYLSHGRQQVAIAIGNSIYVFGLPE